MSQLEDTSAIELLATYDDWVVVKNTNLQYTQSIFCMVWISENKPSPLVIEAAQKINKINKIIPGLLLEFKPKPEPGFVLKPIKGWELETPEQIQQTLEKVVWELNRLSRS